MSNNTAKKPRTLYLDIARTIAIISISINHAVNRTYDNYSGQQAQFLESSLISTFIKTVATVFSHLGVPLFLMITGVLILNKSFENGDDLKRFYKNNYLPIFITTEIWYFLLYWPIVLLYDSSTVLQEQGIFGAILGLIKTMLFLDQTTLGSMWYMPMILCIYLTLPFWAVVVKKFPKKYIFIPLAVTFIYFSVIPLINHQLIFLGKDSMEIGLKERNLVSYYLIYIFLGYFTGKGLLSKVKDLTVALSALLSFAACCAYQWYAYSKPQDYLIDYNFPLLYISALFLFELIRRKAHWFKKFTAVFTYISKISFGIYFVHIVIMEGIYRFYDFSGWRYPVKMLFLEIVSVLGSIVIIALLSKIKIFKKYLFMIKD